MYEIIEDNKHIILLIIVAILLLSTIFAGKSKSNEDKLQVLNNSIQILQNAKKRVNKNKKYPEYSVQETYEPTDFEQYYNQPESEYYENNIEPEMYEEQQKSEPVTEISKESIEDLIKDIRPQKKQTIPQQQSGNMDQYFTQTNKMLESDGNFNRIMELVNFKMNPTTNMRPNLTEQIGTINTGCNKNNEFELEGFDNKILSQTL